MLGRANESDHTPYDGFRHFTAGWLTPPGQIVEYRPDSPAHDPTGSQP